MKWFLYLHGIFQAQTPTNHYIATWYDSYWYDPFNVSVTNINCANLLRLWCDEHFAHTPPCIESSNAGFSAI